MCCAIRKTCRSYCFTSVSKACTSPPRARSTSATSGCTSSGAPTGSMVGLSEGFRGFAPFGDGYRGMQRLLSNFIKGKGHQTPGETISSYPDGSGERILLLFEYE